MPETPHPNKEPRHKEPRLAVLILISALVSIVFGFSAGYVASDARTGGTILKQFSPALYHSLGYDTRAQQDKQAQLDRVKAMKDAVQSEEQKRIAIVKKAVPAVVSIVIEKNMPTYKQVQGAPLGLGNDFFQQLFGGAMPNMTVPQYQQDGTTMQKVGAGTGFFVSSDGLIVTNKHVVADTTATYTVVTNDGTKYTAKVLGRDPSNDLAVLKIDGKGKTFPFIRLSSDKPVVGQSVIAIGYALGQFSNSVSAGIVSGVSRSIHASDSNGASSENLYDVIQTDTAINPGNSGGPLLDLTGKAIGVDVAVVSGSENIGFALPSTDVQKVVDSVKNGGHISRPFLGVRYVIINSDIAKQNQLPYDYGALIVRGNTNTELAVIPGSPADKAGLVENDIILEVDGKKITTDNPLAYAIRDYNVGQKVKMKVFHRGTVKDVTVTLTERQAQ